MESSVEKERVGFSMLESELEMSLKEMTGKKAVRVGSRLFEFLNSTKCEEKMT